MHTLLIVLVLVFGWAITGFIANEWIWQYQQELKYRHGAWITEEEASKKRIRLSFLGPIALIIMTLIVVDDH